MSIDSNNLLAKWVVKLVQEMFIQQQQQEADKLFIRIMGLDEQCWSAVLRQFSLQLEQLSASYKPVLRTLSSVEGYEAFSCKAHETSTWLRNNTRTGQALVIMMNSRTAEAQSLENLFTIDEARLLDQEGLRTLYQVIGQEFQIYKDEMSILQTFIEAYYEIEQPQLRQLLAFLEAVLQEDSSSMINRVQGNLDQFGLFRDDKLQITKAAAARRLKQNYDLARMEKNGRTMKKAELLDNLKQFQNKVQQDSESTLRWEFINWGDFYIDAEAFMERRHHSFLQYQLNLVMEAFNYRPEKKKLRDHLQDFKTEVELKQLLTEKRQALFDETTEMIDTDPDPSTIEEFMDEFVIELQSNTPLQRRLRTMLKKLREFPEYKDWIWGIFAEGVQLCEAHDEELSPDTQIHINIQQVSVNQGSLLALQFLLNTVSRWFSFVHIAMDNAINAAPKPEHTAVCHIALVRNGEELPEGSCSFKMIELNEPMLGSMLERLNETQKIVKVKHFLGNETQDTAILDELEESMRCMESGGKDRLASQALLFVEGLREYEQQFPEFISVGFAPEDAKLLEERLGLLLEKAHQSTHAVYHFYESLNLIGTYEWLDSLASDMVTKVTRRVVTLLNPLRLLGFTKRLQKLSDEWKRWFKAEHPFHSGMGNLDMYLQQLKEQVAQLSPHYFAIHGDPSEFLVEREESLGEGVFLRTGTGGSDGSALETFGNELASVVREYLNVNVYARDCLDLVFLYCTNGEYVKRALHVISGLKKVKKMKLTVHSTSNSARLYEELNNWLAMEEQYAAKYYDFPVVEVAVVAASTVNELTNLLKERLHDADIGILVHYFDQSTCVQFGLERMQVQDSEDWFGTVYREPQYSNENIKRISMISDQLPRLMQRFYQIQYVLHSSSILGDQEHYLLRNNITMNDQNQRSLIDFMHRHMNWTFIIDRYLDKLLLGNVSPQAQIIKYKSNAGKDKQLRTLLSSSKYIRRLAAEQQDHEYFDRLYYKIVHLLQNEQLDQALVVGAIHMVKEVSGGIVLRAIGPGKFTHELLAMYLAMKARPLKERCLTVWAACDELPWFRDKGRRPDLVKIVINNESDRMQLHFEIVELKLIAENLFETERVDAIQQVKVGLELFCSQFDFARQPATASMWHRELIHYLLEHRSYEHGEAQLLEQLYRTEPAQIDTSFSGAIDTFVYNSQLYDLPAMQGQTGGYASELLAGHYTNHIYNRSYILRALGVGKEPVIPSFDVLPDKQQFVAERLRGGMGDSEAKQTAVDKEDKLQDEMEWEHITDKSVAGQIDAARIGDEAGDRVEVGAYMPSQTTGKPRPAECEAESGLSPSNLYPEVEALQELQQVDEEEQSDLEHVVTEYKRKLRVSFHQIGIDIRIVEAYIGISVIRLIVEIPPDKSFSSIANRANDIYLWLRLSSLPLIALRNGSINIDINREVSETVYFERYMQQIRQEYPRAKLAGKLIAPIGVGQLRESVVMDLSSPVTPHLLIGGTTGSGKSVTMNGIILALMCLYEPAEVQFLFIDPKKVEFMAYEGRRHTRQVITELEEAIVVLEELVEEMDRRYKTFAAEGVSSIDQYVELVGQPMERLVVVFDEFADFMEREKALSGRVEGAILLLGAKARAAGIHLLICTQNPKADIVPTNIRNNLPARLALKTADHHASKIIINEDGAEALGGHGDFLMKRDAPETIRGKSPFLTPRVKRLLLQHFKMDKIGVTQ